MCHCAQVEASSAATITACNEALAVSVVSPQQILSSYNIVLALV